MPEITVDMTPDELAAALDREPGDLFRVLAELAALSDDFPAPSFEAAFGEAHTGDAASRRVLPFLRRLVAQIEWVEGRA